MPHPIDLQAVNKRIPSHLTTSCDSSQLIEDYGQILAFTIDDSPFIHERKTTTDYWTPAWEFFALIRHRSWMFEDMTEEEDDENHLYYKLFSEETSVLRRKSREWIFPIHEFQKIIQVKEAAAKESRKGSAVAAQASEEASAGAERQEPVQTA
ncbi:MAG: hypothetical protein Q9208_005324 [Pyrenodesmia sp. 3 TL-2023]